MTAPVYAVIKLTQEEQRQVIYERGPLLVPKERVEAFLDADDLRAINMWDAAKEVAQ